MKFDIKKLKKDIKEIAIPIVAISLFIIIINSKFGKICPLRMLIGIPCPTCGTTRAVGLLLKGKITEAAMVNPIWIFLLVIIVMVFFYRYGIQKKKKAFEAYRYNDFYNNSCSHCCLHIQNDFLLSKQRTYGVWQK